MQCLSISVRLAFCVGDMLGISAHCGTRNNKSRKERGDCGFLFKQWISLSEHRAEEPSDLALVTSSPTGTLKTQKAKGSEIASHSCIPIAPKTDVFQICRHRAPSQQPSCPSLVRMEPCLLWKAKSYLNQFKLRQSSFRGDKPWLESSYRKCLGT